MHAFDLQRQLAQREMEVLTTAHELEEQRVSQLRSDFERRVAEAEMTGLRSQMNPHFIFNCLNSIKLYAIENDSEKASDYLTKFSRLIRLVLENSRSERVTLRNELDMLQLYADMETMRFKQKLSFFVEVEPDVDVGFVEIPPLLLQPYVENAIWHGLMHKPEGGTVRVRASQSQENLLQLTITDDGVGRTRAAELKSKSASHRKSFGMKMTSERIALVNQLYQTHTQVEIQDLVDTDGLPAGTEVIIQIPI
ncbi:sensor histidine kinase [Nibrella saemangeumensis]